MSNYIGIDGGTTNTRLALITDGSVVDILRLSSNVTLGLESHEALVKAIEDGVNQLLRQHPVTVTCILVSGMLTCEFGLYPVPHILAPAGIEELSKHLQKTTIANIPAYFIPGVKQVADSLENCDMMRGEETELVGLIHHLPSKWQQDSVIVLPGSHSKIIHTDEFGRISHFTTTLTGEMAAALSQNTILKDAVVFNSSRIQGEYLLNGYKYAKEKGLNAALFKVRILKNVFKADDAQIYSFFLGIILQSEADLLLHIPQKRIIISGQKALKEGMTILLGALCDKEIMCVPEEVVNIATFTGMVDIYQKAVSGGLV